MACRRSLPLAMRTLQCFMVLWFSLSPLCVSPLKADVGGEQVPLRSVEDSIPVIEIHAEGKPMSAAQIRALEEEAEGKPLDVKVQKTVKPRRYSAKAKRMDFITFHYRGTLENGKIFADTYKTGPCRIQFKVGMTVPGLDKGMTGMCENEQRRIKVPWRLLQSRRGRVWRRIPRDEHWLIFDVEMLKVERWTPEKQFRLMDLNNDSVLTEAVIVRHQQQLEEEYGKHWPSKDIDAALAAKYFIHYFDANDDGKVELTEYVQRMESDLSAMKRSKSKDQGRKRDPDVMWILDFNGDGIVSLEEIGDAARLIEQGYRKPSSKLSSGRTEL